MTVSLGIQIAGAAVRGVFLRCTGLDDPLFAMQALKALGLDTVQVSKLPDRCYTPEGAAGIRARPRRSRIAAYRVSRSRAGANHGV